jgi:YbgC/YbaW family acyl-CoA thioester hydrolase
MLSHAFTVRFHEEDRAGVVFFGRYFEYAHVAFEELLNRAFEGLEVEGTVLGHQGGGLAERMGFGLPLVNAASEYRRPSHGGDRLVVDTVITRLSGRSVAFEHTIRAADDPADVRAVVRLKHAFVSWPGMTGIARPAVFDRGLDRLGFGPLEIV